MGHINITEPCIDWAIEATHEVPAFDTISRNIDLGTLSIYSKVELGGPRGHRVMAWVPRGPKVQI